MAKLGTYKHPAIVRVQTIEHGEEIVALCNEHGWQVIVGVEPDEPEDISDLEELLSRVQKVVTQPDAPPKVSPNDYCPCGSGKKFKNCCGRS